MSDSLTCGMCGTEITGSFFRVGPQEICPTCRDRVTGDAFVQSDTANRELRGLVGAALGAVLGTILYACALLVFSWYGGFAAILVGLVVGSGLSLGTRERPAVTDRLVALGMTYGAIVVGQMPMLAPTMGKLEVFSIMRLLFEALRDSFLLPVTAVAKLGGTGWIFDVFIALAFAATWAASGYQSAPGGIRGPYRLK